MEQEKRLLRALQINGGIAILITAILAFFFFSIYEAAGIIFGGAIGILNFSILIHFVYGILDFDSAKGSRVILSQNTIKFLLILFIFFAIIKWKLANILAVIIGFTIILIIFTAEGLRQSAS
ncbi:MAG: ATP synthase subunit I [Nitrospirae bacterium]|nr:ATP synthase subunit I [Nitrospirota bacterium]